MIKQLLVLVLSISCVKLCCAQTAITDSSLLTSNTSLVIDFFKNSINEQAEIYNGPEYNFLSRIGKGSPFLEDKIDFTNNSLRYNNNWYHDIPLLYDVYNGALVSVQPKSNAVYKLQEQYVTEFFVYGHHFVHLSAVNNDNGKLREGYYQQFYSGKSRVLCKFEKIKTESISTQGPEINFFDKQTFYIVKNGAAYTVNSKGSVLDVFKDKKKEIEIYLKKININYKENRGMSIAKIAAYYDQISI